MKRKNNSKIKELIINHIMNNKKEYVIVTILFCLGFLFGILFINNTSQIQKEQISNYINGFIDSIKQNSLIDKEALLRKSIFNNLILVLILWFAGMSVIGMPIVYGIVAFRGFCLSYTISSMISTLGVKNGILLGLSSVFIQSIILVPLVLAISVSGMKLYKSIMKDRRKENIKLEICRHTIFSFFMCIGLVVSSFVEVYISSNLALYVSGWM